MRRALYSPAAEADVYFIAKHIADEAGDFAPAYRFIDSLEEIAQLIANHPEMGRRRPDLAPRLRSFPVGSFILIYRPTRSGIEIARVVRGSRDIPALF